jgi:hypothetical protein
MADTSGTDVTQDLGSGVAGEPGVAYDAERLGEPGDPGVPKGEQYPTNERENITEGIVKLFADEGGRGGFGSGWGGCGAVVRRLPGPVR